MQGRSSTFAIIPARAGSKRIPKKNTRPFLGIPILNRVVRLLVETEIFGEVLVSTESEEIAEVAKKAGARVPFLRPAHLATDFSTTAEVATHAIDWLIRNGAEQESHFLVAYPTSIMTTSQYIREARELLEPGLCDFVFVGARFPSEMQRAWLKKSENFVEPAFPGNQLKRSQDLDSAYFDAGQFYWATINGWSPEVQEEGKRRRIYEIDSLEAVDINTVDDWERAERLYSFLRRGVEI